MARLKSVLGIFVILVATSAANADRGVAKQHYDRAVKQYNLGNYDAAFEAFTAAYNEVAEPTLLFNLAQCQRQLGNKQRAVTLYRSYLREMAGKASNEDEVRRLITVLDQEISREQATKQTPPQGTIAPPRTTEAPRERSAPAAEPASRTVAQPAVARDVPQPRYRRTAGWVLVGGSVAFLAIGGGLLGGAAAAESRADSAGTLGEKIDLLNRADAFQIGGFSLLGIGAAAAVAAVIVFTLPGGRR